MARMRACCASSISRKREFVTDGFVIPEAKTDMVWQDQDTLIVATDWGPGTLTTSGYPFVVKEWKRGTPLASAREIHRGQKEDVGVSPFLLEGGGGTQFLGINQADTFFTASIFAVTPKGVVRMTLPPKATPRGIYTQRAAVHHRAGVDARRAQVGVGQFACRCLSPSVDCRFSDGATRAGAGAA